MSTAMHRLQISLPHEQARFLSDRARRDGVSIAEIIRRLVRRELEAAPARSVDSLWSIAGVGEDREPLIDKVPVSEQPHLYIAEAASPGYSNSRKCGDVLLI
jgi:hypothetical protein